MGFVADFSTNSFKPKQGATQGNRTSPSFLADFGKNATEPKESFQRNSPSQRSSTDSQMRRAALKSGKFSSFANFGGAASKDDAAKRAKQQKKQKLQNLRNQLKSVNEQMNTVLKAGNVADLTEEKLKDEIGRAKDKLVSRSDQLKMKQKDKEDTDSKLEKTKRMVSVLEARVHGPESRSNDWKWGLGASVMNDCLDLKLGFRLDEKLNESEEYRLRDYLDENRDRVWTLQDRASDKKDELAKVHAEVKVLEKGIAALERQHTKTAATAEALGRKKETLQNKKERLQDQIFRLKGSFTA